MRHPLTATWDGGGLRTIARQLEITHKVSIVLDRRIDPTASHPASATGETLAAFLERLAADASAGATVIGNTVYLGPPAAAARLRTLVTLRTKELADKAAAIGETRRNALRRPSTVRWEDLDRPADVLAGFSRQFGVEVRGLERIPHDLWAGAVLPQATAVEALSLVLVQFDLTFSWADQGRAVRLEPMPERVAIDRPHDPPKGTSAAAGLARYTAAIPGLEAKVEKGKIVVRGTVEQHELVDLVRQGKPLPETTVPREGPPLKRLELQRYTLRIKDTPASALIAELAKPERGKLTFEYDPAELKAAGIDLDALIAFELKDATIEQLLQKTFDPLGVTFVIVDRTISLKPAKK